MIFETLRPWTALDLIKVKFQCMEPICFIVEGIEKRLPPRLGRSNSVDFFTMKIC